jgi:type II secretory ATPase GspE/PulE/Tfp pilus assembly ATPase PilB-like protein
MSSSAKKIRPSNIIPILPPPAAQPDVRNAVMLGEPVEVELLSGARLSGALQKFLRPEKRVVLTLAAGTVQDVTFAHVKVMRLPQPRSWTIEADAVCAGEAVEGSTPQRYAIELKGGETLEGASLGYRSDATGLYLYPIEGAAYTHAYLPFSAVERYRFEPCELAAGPAAETADADPAETPAGAVPRDQAIETPEQLEALLKDHRNVPKLKLGGILLKEGLITEAQLEEALARQQASREQGKNLQIGQVLMELGTIDMEDVLQALAEKLGIPFVDLEKFKMNPEAIRFIPEDLVKKYSILPIHFFGSKLVVALENPMDWEALDAVRFHTNLNIEAVMASKEGLERMIATLYSGPDVQADLLKDYLSAGGEDDEEGEQEYGESNVQDNVIVKLVNKIIIDAYQQRASDIHVEPYPGKHKTIVRIRKDGSLKNYYEVPGKMRNALIARIKIMADLDISEKRKPQDGKIDFKKFGPLKIELRVATIPTTGDQEDVVMRILSSGEPVPLEKLGLSDRNSEVLQRLIQKPYGLFFVCGPTGSGKTTTLHSLLGHLNTADRKIWTAEDPVEITQRGLRQVLVKPKIGLTFAAAMRAFLRADPDIIMVGEMRDKETTSVGIEASLTGHLVFSTLHTNTAPETVTRLLDMGMDPFNFADALIGILAQRLAKRLCPNCKEAYHPSEQELAGLVAEYCYELLPRQASDEERQAVHRQTHQEWSERFAGADGLTLYRPKGCPSCDDTGYRGRVGIHELLVATDAIKKKILEQKTVSDLLETAVREGMRTLKQDGIEKVLLGITDIHMVRTVCIR